MIKYLTLLVISICLCCYSIGFAQTPRQDSLKKILPLLHNKDRVDCLNELAESYSLTFRVEESPHADELYDSMFHYASVAFGEAEKLNYTYGIAVSLTHQAEADVNFDHFTDAENFCREAIRRFDKSANQKGVALAYFILGYALYCQSHFAEALSHLDTAYDLFNRESDFRGKYFSVGLQAGIYNESGNYEKYFDLTDSILAMARQNGDDRYYRYVIFEIGDAFFKLKDYETAIDYFHQAYQGLNQESYQRILGVSHYLTYINLLAKLGYYDSVKYYYSKVDTSEQRALRFYLLGTGELYFYQGQYPEALANFRHSLYLSRAVNDENQVMLALTFIARTWLMMGKTDSAHYYAINDLNMAIKSGNIEIQRDAYQILSSAYERWGKMDSAFIAFKKYTLMNDSVFNIRVKGKILAHKFELKIATLNKDKEIQQVKLRNESQLKKILIGSIVALLILSLIIFRNTTLRRKNEASRRELAENELRIQKLETEKTRHEVQQKTNELTMQALRAQMNPHFIFNSLNSIQSFILQNDSVQATAFLAKFSKLVRLILQNSQTPFITLDNELESLRLYLELEALRFNNHFSYYIAYPPDMEISVVKVPPLIIQPYVENAIWHGLMHKTETGRLDIIISEEEDCLSIQIADNGIGRKESALLAGKTPTRYKAMGMRITADRISILNQAYHNKPSVRILDLVDEQGNATGTEVTIKIPLVYD